jgi:hypothetical protein
MFNDGFLRFQGTIKTAHKKTSGQPRFEVAAKDRLNSMVAV